MACLWPFLVLLQHVAGHAVSEAGCLLQLQTRFTGKAVDIVHILSMGREASCFVRDLVSVNGSHPTIHEPLGGLVEGHSIISMSAHRSDSALQCLYDCHNCTVGAVNSGSYSNLQDYCKEVDGTSSSRPYLVIKTTRVVDHGALVRAVPPNYLASARFVVLLRDPRGVWSSTKPFVGWAIHSIPLICELLALQALTLPELASAVGPRLLIGIYERWTLNTAQFAGQIARLLDADLQKFLAVGKDGQRAKDELLPPSWVTSLTTAELSQIENDANCRAYMERVGYPAGSWNTSQIKSHSGLISALTPNEEDVLHQLRAKQSALQISDAQKKFRSCLSCC